MRRRRRIARLRAQVVAEPSFDAPRAAALRASGSRRRPRRHEAAHASISRLPGARFVSVRAEPFDMNRKVPLDDRLPGPANEALQLAPESIAALQAAVDAHAATWPDMPLPALGGKTLRQAMKTAAVRAAWRRATVEGRVEPFAEDGLTVERALDEAGLAVVARFACADPALHLALDADLLLVVAMDGDGPSAITLEDGPVVAGLKAAAAEVQDALAHAAEPHDAATREAATKAEHALGFALDDARRLTGGPRPE